MTFRVFFTICTAIYGFFGIGLLVAAAPFVAIYDVHLDTDGTVIANLFGGALTGLAVISWAMRDADPRSARPVMLGSFVYHLCGVVISLKAVLSGVAGPAGWLIVLVYAFLGAGFGYLLARKR
jgi:hypothetical protein